MSKKFYAINRKTGERWKPEKGKRQYLMMFDSGFLALVTEEFYTYIEPLDLKKWKKVMVNPKDTSDLQLVEYMRGFP